MIACQRCGKLTDPLSEPPIVGPLGEKIVNNTCKSCWEEWKTMEMKVINEYRLDFSVKDHRQFLINQMKQFLNIGP
ncbi:MAG: Fe(2+)-trafficking protein [Thaumarchaeota archaeon]|nr:Fe(2+)-trafficking protein [Nitrososphaerota archaeon]